MKKSNVLILSLVLAIVVGYIGMVIGYNINGNPTNSVSETKIYTPEELAAEINKLRTEKGIPPLKIDERLNQSAYLAARDMQRDKYYGHVNPISGKHGYENIPASTGTECQFYSENINDVISIQNPVTDSVGGWLVSKEHNAAQLDERYDTVGFSSFISSEDGSNISNGDIIYVAHFCDLR
jgi:uncharacterized protein YkwD